MNMDASLELVNYYEKQYSKSYIKPWSIIPPSKKTFITLKVNGTSKSS